MRVNRTGRIVGRIDNDGGSLIGNGALDVVDVYLEGFLICKRFDTGATGLLDPYAILGKIRSDDNNLIAGIGDSSERACERSCSTNRHEHVLALVRRAKATIQGFCHRSAAGGQARSGRIAMDLLTWQLKGPFNRIVDCGGRRNARITQREIKHVLGTDLRLAFQSIGKNLADN